MEVDTLDYIRMEKETVKDLGFVLTKHVKKVSGKKVY